MRPPAQAVFTVLIASTAITTAGHGGPTGSDTVSYVIHISVDGLRPDAVTTLGETVLPHFFRLRTEGAFTDNARTDIDFTNTMPNHASMMTGRRVLTSQGHGVTFNDSHPGTFASVHGSYVAGVFDVAHDRGLRTAHFYSKDKFDFYSRSWDAEHGAPDTVGVDDGTAKIDVDVFRDDTSELTDVWLGEMEGDPFHYTFLHFRDPDTFGHARQWMSPQYLDAVATVDGYLGRIFDLIDNDVRFAGKTAIVLTSDHGGSGTDHNTDGEPLHFTVPVFAWGPGVTPGGDLYQLNWDTRKEFFFWSCRYLAPLLGCTTQNRWRSSCSRSAGYPDRGLLPRFRPIRT